MRVWLINTGEPLPIDPGHRPLRAGLLARQLLAAGHEVVWWTSTFNHGLKTQRFPLDKTIDVESGFRLRLLHSVNYSRNLSLRRLLNHIGVANRFRSSADTEKRPHIILCSLPTLELSAAATEYGQQMDSPVLLDVRDLWPDIFVELFPRAIRAAVRFVLEPLFHSSRQSCRRAEAIVGITPEYVDWGLKKAGRERREWDRDFPLGYSDETPPEEDIRKAEAFWDQLGISSNSDEFNVCFFGMMGWQVDLSTAILAAKELAVSGRKVKLVLCGTGDRLQDYKQQALSLGAPVLFPGWVGRPQIWSLMRRSAIGLCPYIDTINLKGNIPNKPIEYLSGRLPLVSSISGALSSLLERHECGITYAYGKSEHLAAALASYYDKPEMRLRQSHNAFELFKSRFRAETVYAEMTTYMQQLVASRRAPVSN